MITTIKVNKILSITEMNRIMKISIDELTKLIIFECDNGYGASINEFNSDLKWDLINTGKTLIKYVSELSVPTIYISNGYCIGGHNELAMACDFRIGTINSKYGQPEIKLGILPCFNGTELLFNLVSKPIGKMMIFTGDTYSFKFALEIGLVDFICETKEECDIKVKEFYEKIEDFNIWTLKQIKRCLSKQQNEYLSVTNCLNNVKTKEIINEFCKRKRGK